MKRHLPLLLAAAVLAAVPAAAQVAAPEIAFDSANPLTLPDNIYLGEVAGVATNSKGDIFVYTRTGHPTVTLGTARPFAHGGSQMFQFDRTGKFVREIGKDIYGFLFAEQVRVDPQDNIWVVDQMSNMVMKFDPEGRVALLLGRKAEAIPVPAPRPGPAAPAAGPAAAAAALPGAGRPSDLFDRPTDVAWDAAGNIYVADGAGNARVAKFTKAGVFIKSWGSKGTEPGKFGSVRGIAIDAQGNVYVADGGNKRIQVFDGDGNFKTQFANVGNARALCMTSGPTQYLYTSNSNPPNDIDTGGEIYKLRLDGTIVGKFGRAGKLPKEFGTVNEIDCRTENSLYVGEIGNLRVQKITLH
jgi:DNA-binding beta-propeller fold protein YncE